jgi:hypothetical protein
MKNKTLIALAVAALWSAASTDVFAQCGDNVNTPQSWDGGGTTESFFDANNWVSNTVPDCDDDISFGSGTKDCRISSSVTVRDFNVINTYKGRVYLEGTGTTLTARDVNVNGTLLVFNVETGVSTMRNLTVTNNGLVNASSSSGITITGTLNLPSGGYFQTRFKSTMNVSAIIVGAYSQFKGPQEGRIFLSGNFSKHKVSTYDHRKSTLFINGDDAQSFHVSSGTGQTAGSCELWNVVLNKTNTTTSNSDNFFGNDLTDTLVIANRLTLTDGDFRQGIIKLLDTVEFVGLGNNGHAGDFWFAGTKTADMFVNSGTENPTVNTFNLYVDMHTNANQVKVWKGTANAILIASGNVIVNKGDLRFDEDVPATIRHDFTVIGGRITAPATNTLIIQGSWTTSVRGALNPRTGTVSIQGASDRSFNQNNNAIFFYNLNIDSARILSWNVSSNDTIWVNNDLNHNLAGANLRNVVLVSEGDINTGASSILTLDLVVAAGGNTQVFTLGNSSQIETEGLMINKSGGIVQLGADIDFQRLTLKNGNIQPGAYKLLMHISNAGGNGIIGGNTNSFVDGKVYLNHPSVWAASKFKCPVGKGSKYRPITLHNISSTNAWEVEFIDSDPNGLGSSPSLNGGIDALTTDGYWTATRTIGGAAGPSNASYFEISDGGKGSWNNSDLRVAKFASNAWDNLGGTFTSDAVISTNGTQNGNDAFIVTLAVDNVNPINLVNGEVVSGNELATGQVQNAPVANTANGKLSFEVFPNPFAGELCFRVSNASRGVISVSDLNGKTIASFDAGVRSANLSNLSAGVYVVTFTDGINRIAQRVIKY